MPRAKGYLLAYTPERIEEILTDWRGGATCAQMATRFDLTKNMITGIVGRNKQPGETSERTFFHSRPSESREKPTLPTVKRPPRLRGKKMPTGRSVVKTHRMVGGLHFRTCQWIAGEPRADDACKCGSATGPGRVYCPEHEIRARRPVQSEEAA